MLARKAPRLASGGSSELDAEIIAVPALRPANAPSGTIGSNSS